MNNKFEYKKIKQNIENINITGNLKWKGIDDNILYYDLKNSLIPSIKIIDTNHILFNAILVECSSFLCYNDLEIEYQFFGDKTQFYIDEYITSKFEGMIITLSVDFNKTNNTYIFNTWRIESVSYE